MFIPLIKPFIYSTFRVSNIYYNFINLWLGPNYIDTLHVHKILLFTNSCYLCFCNSLSTEDSIRCVRMMPSVIGGRRMVEESCEIAGVHLVATSTTAVIVCRWAHWNADIEATATSADRHDVSEIETVYEKILLIKCGIVDMRTEISI